jgi:hypothetical protein
MYKTQVRFYKFFTQLDKHKDTDFPSTFREMKNWRNTNKNAEVMT